MVCKTSLNDGVNVYIMWFNYKDRAMPLSMLSSFPFVDVVIWITAMLFSVLLWLFTLLVFMLRLNLMLVYFALLNFTVSYRRSIFYTHKSACLPDYCYQ